MPPAALITQTADKGMKREWMDFTLVNDNVSNAEVYLASNDGDHIW
jgi:hypothetical protein